jgi:hypothetical protein
MPAIPLEDAVEQLAQAVEKATPEDLLVIFTELFPTKPLPDVSSASSAAVAAELARHIRTGVEPEEVVDLWNLVYPSARNVYYDEEDRSLRQNERGIRYAGQ